MSCARGSGDHEAWLVGGAVRDLLLGGTRADLDLVVEGDAASVAALLGAEAKSHERFGTASVSLGGGTRGCRGRPNARRMRIPGRFPTCEPSALAEDLARRDFTVNAMALPLLGTAELIDPHGGRADLERGVLRILHSRSFEDDPTRALRAARYAARLGLALDAETKERLVSRPTSARFPRTGSRRSSGASCPRNARRMRWPSSLAGALQGSTTALPTVCGLRAHSSRVPIGPM